MLCGGRSTRRLFWTSFDDASRIIASSACSFSFFFCLIILASRPESLPPFLLLVVVKTHFHSFIMLTSSTAKQSSKLATAAVRRGTVASQQVRTILGVSSALDKRLYRMAKSVMPTISKTEQIALGSGTIGFDRDIFSGSPSLKKLVDTYKPALSKEEQDFIDNQVNTLCAMINDHDVVTTKDFNRETWDYMRDEKFFGLKIPKEWGGMGFSTQAVSHILAKLGTQSSDANATVAVPNSLGPGELLVRYGTAEQKEYFLPRLADGTLIPCFGLTGPHSGSDATSLIGSDCIVQKRNGELGVVASFKKRYITLAPVAGVVGLGLNLADPDNLLQGTGHEGFTVALLERDHPGLRMGKRHFPLNAAFMNGTVEGEDVWIPMSMILGGQEKCGYGWNMFVECLAEGRGVSLPAGSVATGRATVASVGAYTRVRKQFKVPIAEFGGIQEGTCGTVCNALLLWSTHYIVQQFGSHILSA
jgi:acyl-CoA dehydrogenase